MPSASVWYDILTRIQSLIQGLDLSGLSDANVKVRKLPKVGESIDTLPCVLVSPGDSPEDVERLSFEDDSGVSVRYPADIVIVAAGNRDFSSNLDLYAGWRQSIRRLFQDDALDGVDRVFRVDIEPKPLYDRGLLNQNYDYLGMSVWVTVAEQRGN